MLTAQSSKEDYSFSLSLLGLASSCPKFLKTLQLLKSCSKVAFCNESCSKVAKKCKNLYLFLSSFICSGAKICKLYNKSNISKQFCAILRCNQRR